MTSLKFNCIEVTYNNILYNKEELYNTIRTLAQKGAKTSATPSAYITHCGSKTVALLIYDKTVDWKNLRKLDIDKNEAIIKKINKENIHSAIQALTHLDPDIYPPNLDIIFTIKSKPKSKIAKTTNRELEEDEKIYYLSCTECYRNILSKNFNSSQKKCKECIERKTKIKSAKEKYLELDPRGIIKDSIELIDEFTMFDKRRNLTKAQVVDEIIELKSQLNTAMLMLHNVCKISNISIAQNMDTKKRMYLYLINFGNANKIITSHFVFHERDNIDLTNKRLLKFGLTDDIDQEIKKYNREFKYLYDKVDDKIKYIVYKETDNIFGPVKEQTLIDAVKKMGVHYTMRDTTNILENFDDKLIICNDKNIDAVSAIITYT